MICCFQKCLESQSGRVPFFPSLNLLVHASYDRVFQTPALENLLLASSPEFDSVNPIVVRFPVEPAQRQLL